MQPTLTEVIPVIRFEATGYANAMFTWICGGVKYAITWPATMGDYAVLIPAEELARFKASSPDLTLSY